MVSKPKIYESPDKGKTIYERDLGDYKNRTMIVDYIKSHYEVRVKDTDPDTGEVYRDWPVALTKDPSSAEMIANALNRCSYEPNRDFYTVYRDTIVNC